MRFVLNTTTHGPTSTTASIGTVNVPTTQEYYLLGSLLLFVTISGTLLNGLSIIVLTRYREFHSSTSSFIIALCICDLSKCCLAWPMSVIYAFNKSSMNSEIICVSSAFLVFLMTSSSFYILASISIDRYIIIVKPRSTHKITRRTANYMIALSFSFGFFWAMMPLTGWNGYSKEGTGVGCSVTWNSRDTSYLVFIFMFLLFCFIIPFVVMSFCYISIYIKVRHVLKNSDLALHSSTRYAVEKRMVATIIVVIFIFFACWTPYAFFRFYLAFSAHPRRPNTVETLTSVIAKSSSVMNPIVYVTMNRYFRRGMICVLTCRNQLYYPEPQIWTLSTIRSCCTEMNYYPNSPVEHVDEIIMESKQHSRRESRYPSVENEGSVDPLF